MNMVNIKINGNEYSLKGEENSEYLNTVAQYVDNKMKQIIEKRPELSDKDSAVLTAVNVADDFFKLEKEFEEYKEESEKKFFETVDQYKTKVAELQKQLMENEIYLIKEKKRNRNLL